MEKERLIMLLVITALVLSVVFQALITFNIDSKLKQSIDKKLTQYKINKSLVTEPMSNYIEDKHD